MANIKSRTHVLQDLQPYVCTVEDCDEPTTQFNSRRSCRLHEIRRHELEPGDSDSDLLERKLSESATGACIFCGEQTGARRTTLKNMSADTWRRSPLRWSASLMRNGISTLIRLVKPTMISDQTLKRTLERVSLPADLEYQAPAM